MPKDTAQSNSNSSLFTLHSSLSLEEARALAASPLWPRIRAFLWDFASLCDPRRLSAAAEGSTRAPRAFEDASGIVPETPPASFEGDSAAVRSEEHSVQGTPAQPALNVREADLERAADAASGTGGFAALANALATTPRVAASALRALGVEATFHSFPSADSSRLLLLSREDYDRLARFLGVVALAPALRRVTAGAEVRALKAALPGVYPEALAFAAYFHKHESLFKKVAPADAPANAETICAAGHSILAAALSKLPPELLLRHRLRFPAGSPADAALGAVFEGAFGAVGKPPSAALEDSLRSPSEGGSAAVQVKSGTPAKPASNAREADFERGRSPLGTTGKAGLGTAEAAAALAAARLALKLSNPTEYSTLCS